MQIGESVSCRVGCEKSATSSVPHAGHLGQLSRQLTQELSILGEERPRSTLVTRVLVPDLFPRSRFGRSGVRPVDTAPYDVPRRERRTKRLARAEAAERSAVVTVVTPTRVLPAWKSRQSNVSVREADAWGSEGASLSAWGPPFRGGCAGVLLGMVTRTDVTRVALVFDLDFKVVDARLRWSRSVGSDSSSIPIAILGRACHNMGTEDGGRVSCQMAGARKGVGERS
jgi:hypothetical protein